MFNVSFFQILVLLFLIFLIFGDTKKIFSNLKELQSKIFKSKEILYRKNGTRTHSSGFGDQRFTIKLSSLLKIFNIHTNTFWLIDQ